jgi:putative endonuclease
MKTQKQLTGAWGEKEAVQFLEAKGYTILEKNFRTRMGEIDIIALHEKIHHGNTLIFIEVKTREGEVGSAERAVTKTKLRNLFSAARSYCTSKNISLESTPIQFEQVSVYGKKENVDQIFHYIIPVE